VEDVLAGKFTDTSSSSSSDVSSSLIITMD